MNKKTNSAPLSSQVEAKLLQYIKDNKLKEGAKLPNETTLSRTFSVGRSSLREATSRLISRGVLEVRQGSGTFILDPIPSDEDPLGLRFEKNNSKICKDLISLLIDLEPNLAALAARNATEKDIQNIAKAAKNEEDKIEFHTLIAKSSNNCLSENLIKILYSTTNIFNNNLLSINTNKYYLNIINCIKNKDEIRAKLTMYELLNEMYSNTI